MWEGPLCPDCLLFLVLIQPRPWICDQIPPGWPAWLPILGFLNQFFFYRILFDVIGDVSELARCSNAGFIIRILPGTAVAMQICACLGRYVAHERMHELR